MKPAPWPLRLCLLLGPLIPAWLGVDFSPSYTLMFLFAAAVLLALAELLPAARRLMESLAAALGAAVCLPAVFIYSFGDDALMRSVRLTAVLGAVLFAGLWLLTRRQTRGILRLRDGLLLLSGLFTCLCAVPCPFLWSWGLGLLALLGAGLLPKPGLPRTLLASLGLCGLALFSAAPMLL